MTQIPIYYRPLLTPSDLPVIGRASLGVRRLVDTPRKTFCQHCGAETTDQSRRGRLRWQKIPNTERNLVTSLFSFPRDGRCLTEVKRGEFRAFLMKQACRLPDYTHQGAYLVAIYSPQFVNTLRVGVLFLPNTPPNRSERACDHNPGFVLVPPLKRELAEQSQPPLPWFPRRLSVSSWTCY